jgi:hypothetical protein
MGMHSGVRFVSDYEQIVHTFVSMFVRLFVHRRDFEGREERNRRGYVYKEGK